MKTSLRSMAFVVATAGQLIGCGSMTSELECKAAQQPPPAQEGEDANADRSAERLLSHAELDLMDAALFAVQLGRWDYVVDVLERHRRDYPNGAFSHTRERLLSLALSFQKKKATPPRAVVHGSKRRRGPRDPRALVGTMAP